MTVFVYMMLLVPASANSRTGYKDASAVELALFKRTTATFEETQTRAKDLAASITLLLQKVPHLEDRLKDDYAYMLDEEDIKLLTDKMKTITVELTVARDALALSIESLEIGDIPEGHQLNDKERAELVAEMETAAHTLTGSRRAAMQSVRDDVAELHLIWTRLAHGQPLSEIEPLISTYWLPTQAPL